MRHAVTKALTTCGETLVETLAAVLMCSLAAMLMMTAIVAAGNMNASANIQAHDLQVQQRLAAQHSGYYVEGGSPSTDVTGTVLYQDIQVSIFRDQVDVVVAGGDSIVSYDWKDAT